MKRWQWAGILVAVVCAAGVFGVAPQCEALVLRGQFPIQNGMYWNFSDNATQQRETWAVLGRFARSGVGSLIVLARQGDGFLALKEEWDGLYLHGEYRTDGFTLPETPVMFMPFEIDFDEPVKNTTRMRVYAAGEDPRLVAEYDYSVIIALQALEDITIEDREIRNCTVLVKKVEAQGIESIETFWLAPSIGPVRMRVEGTGIVRNYALQTYRTDRGAPAQEFALTDYFPLKPGTLYEYRDRSGTLMAAKIGQQEERLGRQTISYTEPGGDVYYLSHEERGLVFPLKYVASMGFAFVSLPPDRPPVLLPARSAVGRLNHSLSYVRPSQWPSLQPMLDFYPESEIASVIVGIEDVTVPAGTYRDCIKLCFSSVNRSFNMQREKIRIGFIWFARGVGEVKREGLSFANSYLDESPDFIFQTERWELAGIRQLELPEATGPAAVPGPQASAVRVSVDALEWQGNSKSMLDAAVNAAPFFVRRIARKNLIKAVIDRVDVDGLVSEDMLIAAVEATTPEKMRAKLAAQLEQMKTR